MSDLPPNPSDPTGRWHGYLIIGNTRSTDGREFVTEGGGWRDLPLPLMLMEENDEGHDGSVIAGSIETIEIQGDLFYAEGTYAATDAGARAAQLVGDQTLRWLSADVQQIESEVFAEVDGDERAIEDISEDELFESSTRIIERFTKWQIMGATILAFPAFPQAVIAPIDQELTQVTEDAMTSAASLGVVVACGYEDDPPADWFDDPKLDQLTPLTITEDGRVFGHCAGWGIPHISFQGGDLYAPRSRSGYAHFTTGALRARGDGGKATDVAVGQITLGTGHADLQLDHRGAAAHYDNTGAAAADVAVGEDDFGIWFAGGLRPGVTSNQVRQLRASALSGDWRKIGGNLELVGLLAVNVPGFGVPRTTAGMRKGEELSLVAAGIVRRGPSRAAMQHQLDAVVAAIRPFIKDRAEQIAQKVREGQV